MTGAKRKLRPYGHLSYRRKAVFFITLIFGCFLGIFISYSARMLFVNGQMTKFSCLRARIQREPQRDAHGFAQTAVFVDRLESLRTKIRNGQKLVMVSVMTADRFLVTRAKTINVTWGETIESGTTLFFTGEESNTSVSLNVVKLPGVNDGYPPQRKSFHMLKYLYDNYINDFHWFVRADDDVYIHTKRLSEFLRRLDSSEDVLVGHFGVGKPHEKGKLGIEQDNNFCLGGPGVVMSHSVLRKLGPYLVTCLNETVTTHEDTELTRCIRRYVGVICPWAQQARNLFYQMYETENIDEVLSGSLDKKGLRSVITVHPIKNPTHMFRLHYIYQSQIIQQLVHRTTQLQRTHERINHLMLNNNSGSFSKAYFYGRLPKNGSSYWASFTMNSLYGLGESAVEWVSGRILQTIRNVIRVAMKHINAEGTQRLDPPEDFKKLYLGRMRAHATQGLQFILDIDTIRKPSVPDAFEKPRYLNHYVHLQQSFAPLLTRTVPSQEMSALVHFIVPLAGRFQTFQRFLTSFEESFVAQKKQVSLLVVYFPDVLDPKEHKERYEAFGTKHPDVILNWLELAGEFSRARALELGSKCCGDDALLFFSDVDFIFRTEFHERCRRNTSPGQRVYFPIFFSQYKPEVAYDNQPRPPWDSRIYTKRAGTWREYSYGPVCVYAGDVKAVGGLDTNIRGWGLEDLDFYEKCLKYELEVFRASDLGLLHIYHQQSNCLDPRLNAEQAKMCNDSRLQGIASAHSLVDYLHSRSYV